MNENLKALIESALKFVGTPYKYGGNHVLEGFDCSSLQCEILRSVGMVGIFEDLSAQNLLDKYALTGARQDIKKPEIGSLIFYGKSAATVTHVALAISNYSILEAGGGDHTTVTKEVAALRGACVRVRGINGRSDKVGAYLPNYPWL